MTMGVEFRNLTESDLNEVYGLEIAAHDFPWSENTMKRSLRTKRCIGLCVDGVLSAYAIVSVVVDEAELLDIVTAKEKQGMGYGGRLLDYIILQLIGEAERFFLEVRVSNESAISLYDRLGFVEVGSRENYYPAAGGHEDALLMALEVSQYDLGSRP